MDKAINYNNIYNQINLLLLVVTITIGFYCWILSYGFTDHSPLTIIKAISFTSILLFLPDFIFLLLNKISSPNKYQWFRSVQFITLLVIIMLLLLSVLQSVWSLKLYSYLSYFGLFLILAFIIRYLVYYFKFIDIIYSVFTILFAFFLGSIVWGAGYTSPLIVEQLSTIQIKEIDTLYHAAVTGMIKTYNIPSTGLNGIPFLPYHWGSHWIIAQFSCLVNVSAIQFYNLCFPIIFIPLFFKCFFMFILSIRKHKNITVSFGWLFYIVLFFVFIHFLSNFAKAAIIGERNLVGLLFTFLFLAIIVELLSNKINFQKSISRVESIFIIITLPIILGFITLTQISIGYILIGLYGYLFIRLKWYKIIQVTISFIISFIIFGLINYITTFLSGGSAGSAIINVSIFHTLKTLIRYGSISFIFQYLWVLCFIVLYLYKKEIRTFEELKNAFLSKNHIIELEFLPVILFLGLLPGIVIHFGGGIDYYFFNFQYWISLGLILAYLPYFINVDRWRSHISEKKLISFFIIFIFFCLTIESSGDYFKVIKDNIKNNLYVRQSIIDGKENSLKYNGQQLFSIALNNNKADNPFHSLLAYARNSQKVLDNNPAHRLIMTIKKLNKLELSEKRKTCIYIPKTNRIFWDMQTFRFDGTPFIVPALSGIAMIEGLPDYLYSINKLLRGYKTYQRDYNSKYVDNFTSLNLADLRAIARDKGFSQIIKITFLNNEPVLEKIEI